MTFDRGPAPARRTRRRAGPGTVVALVLLAIAALALAGGILAARYLPILTDAQRLRETASTLAAEVDALSVADLDGAAVDRVAARIADLDVHLAPVRDLLATDPLVGLARALPGIGDQVIGADRVVGAADRLVEAAGIGIDLARQLQDARDRAQADPDSSLMEGIVRLMATSTGDVDRMATLLAEAQDQLQAVPAGVLPQLAEARDQMAGPLGRYAPMLAEYQAIDGTLASLLGWESPKRYLVLAQNPAELRPTGGYTGTVGIIGLDKGRLVEKRFFTVYLLDLRPDTPWVQPPEPLVNHLLGDEQAWRLADANWSPDFPTSAKAAASLYTLESGDAGIDGVIAITTHALDRILEVTGPVDVPAFGVTVKPGDVTMAILAATRPGTRDEAERKAVLDALAETMLDRLQSLPAAAWTPLLEELQAIGSERSAMAWFRDPTAQALAMDTGWAGQVRRDPGDYLAVVEANMAPTSKYNLVVRRSSSLDVDLAPDGSGTSSLRMDWQNDSDHEGEPYASIRSYSTSPDGYYGAYVRALVPDAAELVTATGRDTDRVQGVESVESEAGRTAFGTYLLMPPGQSTLTYLWTRPGVAEQAADGTWAYRLTVQKQPGAASEPLDVRVDLPDGATVLESSDGLVVDGSRLRLKTDLTHDLELEVRYTVPDVGVEAEGETDE